MAEISAAQVKTLRNRTDAGMMDCKRALVEADGDLDRAVVLLRQRGFAKARGKAGRSTSEGSIAASVSLDRRQGALVEINCETDFVARTDKFEALCVEVARAVCQEDPADVDTLLALASGDGSVNDRIVEAIAALGENIQVCRLVRLEAGPRGTIGSYIHAGGKIGTLVQVEADDPERSEVRAFARDLCMHVAATSPIGVSRDDIPAAEIERERAVLAKQAKSEGRPANVVEKMVNGRLNKFLREIVLLDQPLVMNPDQSVAATATKVGAAVVRFRRFQLGEELDG